MGEERKGYEEAFPHPPRKEDIYLIHLSEIVSPGHFRANCNRIWKKYYTR